MPKEFERAAVNIELLERVRKLDYTGNALFEGKAKGINRNVDWLIAEHTLLIELIEVTP